MLLTLRKLYSDFPWVFDTLYPVIYDYAKDFSCYDLLLKASGAKRILDLGCGTGLLARYLVQAGYEYTGVDLSASMLTIAHRKIPPAHFIQCDMRDLSSLRSIDGQKFDAVLCTGRAFAHLTLDSEIHTCLRAVVELLQPGGIFACDSIDARNVVANPVQRVMERTSVGSREFRRDFVHTRLPGESTTLHTTIHWRISEGESIIAEFDEEARHRAFLPDELARFLSTAGLRGNLACTPLPHHPVILLASACKVEV